MSLRFRFLALLVLVPSACLGLFAFSAYSTFVSDKSLSILEHQLEMLGSVQLLLSKVPTDELATRVAEFDAYYGFGHLLLLDAEGKVRAAVDTKNNGKALNEIFADSTRAEMQKQASPEGSFTTTTAGGATVLASFRKIDVSGEKLTLFLAKEKSPLMRVTWIFLIKALATLLALYSFATLSSILIWNGLFRDIAMLSKAIQVFATGNVDAPLPEARFGGEIGRLGQHFQNTRRRIVSLIAEKEKTAREQATREATQKMPQVAQSESPAELSAVSTANLTQFSEQRVNQALLLTGSSLRARTHFAVDQSQGAKATVWTEAVTIRQSVCVAWLSTQEQGTQVDFCVTAVRAVLSTIAEINRTPSAPNLDISLVEIMQILNAALVQTQLKLGVTFLLLDQATGEVTWSSAGLFSPVVLEANQLDFNPDLDLSKLRSKVSQLGENRETIFKQDSLKLSDGASVVLVSDEKAKRGTIAEPQTDDASFLVITWKKTS